MINLDQIELIEGGAELLDLVKPFWEKLQAYHASVSKYFSQDIDEYAFAQRKKGLLKKVMNGKLKVDIVKCLENGNIIGYCISTIDADNVGEIESIFVEEAYRGNRIGEALMKNAIEWFDDNHVEVRKLYIVYGNDSVIELYKKYGFYPLNIVFRQIM
ncbi:MAG: GNAT family N-acetyltransferase [bacterium]|nr:MAG: GNAT family N-acetyltransferase [bacterium]